MTDYEKLEERRQRMRSNYYAQLAMMGYDSSGNALDLVKVVRCRDCKHSYFASNRVPDEQCWTCGKHGIDVTTDWFCADGERRDDNGKDA